MKLAAWLSAIVFVLWLVAIVAVLGSNDALGQGLVIVAASVVAVSAWLVIWTSTWVSLLLRRR